MVPYTLLSPGMLEIDGVRIFLDHADNDSKFRNNSRDDAFYMAKNASYLDSYEELNSTPSFTGLSNANILELGIFTGGSAVFFYKLYQPRTLVCVDFMPKPAPALETFIRDNKIKNIRTYYDTDQANKPKLREIIESEFSGPLDLVIDDASHFYENSRASFEAIFPYLAPGGIYVVEDWGWAHNAAAGQSDHMWANMTALTNLIFRFVAMHGADLGLVRRIGFSVGMMWVQKGIAELPKRDFALDQYERPRGREIPLV